VKGCLPCKLQLFPDTGMLQLMFKLGSCLRTMATAMYDRTEQMLMLPIWGFGEMELVKRHLSKCFLLPGCESVDVGASAASSGSAAAVAAAVAAGPGPVAEPAMPCPASLASVSLLRRPSAHVGQQQAQQCPRSACRALAPRARRRRRLRTQTSLL
jgi:hypothetical protein